VGGVCSVAAEAAPAVATLRGWLPVAKTAAAMPVIPIAQKKRATLPLFMTSLF
jgi:hypothetical protein